MKKVSCLLIVCSVTFCSLQIFAAGDSNTPAFPGAAGAGKWTKGGRAGRAIYVTNLNDAGLGSLRHAVEAEEPRTVIFAVSGNIELASELKITNPFITIAGQTAPGDGICLKYYPLIVAADNVIIRFMRVRPSDNAGKEIDAVSVIKGSNIILDHCSASWSVDEVLSIGPSPAGPGMKSPDNVTIQWCIISESLNLSVHRKGKHGYGTLAKGGFGSKYSFGHNLYAHHKARCPYPGNYSDISIDPEGLTYDFRNNVIYNWGNGTAGYNTQNKADSVTKMNFVANYYKQGPNTTDACVFFQREPTSKAYFAENLVNHILPDDPWSIVRFDEKLSTDQIQKYKQSEPFTVEALETTDALTAYQNVLDGAGAILPKRDPIDERIVNDVKNVTGAIIDDEEDVGSWPKLKSKPALPDSDGDGMPDEWEIKHCLNPNDPADGPADDDNDGYTNLEEYLNFIVLKGSV